MFKEILVYSFFICLVEVIACILYIQFFPAIFPFFLLLIFILNKIKPLKIKLLTCIVTSILFSISYKILSIFLFTTLEKEYRLDFSSGELLNLIYIGLFYNLCLFIVSILIFPLLSKFWNFFIKNKI